MVQSSKTSSGPSTVSYLHFMMYFHRIESLEALVMRPMCQAKQMKLSHLIAMNGPCYLMEGIIKAIRKYESMKAPDSESDKEEVKNYLEKELDSYSS